MKAFKDYNETKAFSDFQKILPGAYIAEIKAAEEKTYSGQNGEFSKLEILFDIAEGDFKDYYTQQYKSSDRDDKKWKGKIAIYIPTDDGSEQDAKTKRRFKTVMEAIEESNSGYHWDWDEKKLKGKKIGVVLQNKEWDYNGKTGWSAVPYSLTSVASVRDGSFYMPKDKPLNQEIPVQTSPTEKADFEEITDDFLPF